MTQTISVDQALALIENADAVSIDGIPAAIKHYIGDDDRNELEENPDHEATLVTFSYTGFDYLDEAELRTEHVIEVPKDRSGLIVKDVRGCQQFTIEFLQNTKVEIPESESDELDAVHD